MAARSPLSGGYRPLGPCVEPTAEDARSPDEVEKEKDSCRCATYEESVFRNHAKHAGDGKHIDFKNIENALDDLKLKDVAKKELPRILEECDLDDDSWIDEKEFQLILNLLLIDEALEFTSTAEKKKENLLDSLSNWTQSYNAAKELHECWGRATPQKFLRWLDAMDGLETDQDRARMLDSLMITVPIRDKEGKEGKWQAGIGNKRHISFGKYKGDVMTHNNAVVVHSNNPFPLPERRERIEDTKVIDFKKDASAVENFLFGRRPGKYCLAYTSVQFLFDTQYLPLIVHAIEGASVKSGIFDSPLVQVVLGEAWHRSQKVFYFNMLLDLMLIVTMTLVAKEADKWWCPTTIACLSVCSLYYFVGEVLGLSAPCRRWRNRRHGPMQARFIGSFWSIFDTLMSIYFLALMVLYLAFRWQVLTGTEAVAWFVKHPIWIVMFLAAKTTHLIIKLLCVRVLGQRIVPAYHAMTSAASKAFLLFLCLMFANAVLTFHALPIKVYNPKSRHWWDPWENFFDASVLQFHSNFLGESEPEELEQETQEIKLHRRPGWAFVGDLSGHSMHSYFHHGVQILNVVFVVLIHIIMLNVYISVLGQRYDKAVGRKHAHFEKFRAVFSRKTLTRCPCLCRRRETGPYVWIAYKARLGSAKQRAEGLRQPPSEPLRPEEDPNSVPVPPAEEDEARLGSARQRAEGLRQPG